MEQHGKYMFHSYVGLTEKLATQAKREFELSTTLPYIFQTIAECKEKTSDVHAMLQEEVISTSSEEVFYINTPQQLVMSKDCNIAFETNGSVVNFKLDTGEQTNVITESVVAGLQRKIQL